jgi:hypothetical protein
MTTISNPKELITNKIFDRDEMQFVLFVDDRQGKRMRLFSLRFRLSHDSSERERERERELIREPTLFFFFSFHELKK